MNLHSVHTRLTFWNVTFLALVLAFFTGMIHYTVTLNLTSGIDGDLQQELLRSQGVMNRIWTEREYPDELYDMIPGFGPDRHHGLGSRGPGSHEPEGHDFQGFGGPHHEGPPFPMENRTGRIPGVFLSPGLFDAKGKAVAPFSTDRPWSHEAFTLSLKGTTLNQTTTLEGMSVRLLSAPFKWEGKVAGVIQIVRPLDELNQLLENVDRTLLMLILPALIVAGLSGAFLTNRSLRPVKQISQAASQLAASDLSRRLPVKGNDEFSELARNFNRMTERLETAFGDLESAYANLESAYERQRRFTADASHELRTPLTTIRANTSLALSGEEDVDIYKEALEEADTAACAMSRIVEDLLFLARSDNSGLRLDVKTLPAQEALESAVAAVSPRRIGSPIEVVLHDPSLTLTVDPHHLKRLLINLVENAVRHTPPDGRITVSAEGRGDSVLLRVEDTGDGIAPEHLPHLFERFYRVDDARSRGDGGAGLGLAICQSIVQAHGGEIEIQSRPGEGTVVTVSLPAPAGDAMPLRIREAEPMAGV